MKKKGLFAILAVLTVFAMVMTSCDTGGGGDDNITISFDLQGGPGTAPASATIKKGGSLGASKMPGPMDAGIVGGKIYTFNGWFDNATGGNEVDATTTFAQNSTVYAQWDASMDAPPDGSVAVIFNFNWPITGGPSAITRNIVIGQTIGSDLVTPTGTTQIPTKYKFTKWNTLANGSGTEVNASTSITAPATGELPIFEVYAQWEELWNVTFDLRGGSPAVLAQNGLTTGSLVTAPSSTPTKANDAAGSYSFNGWFKEVSQTTPWDFSTDRVTKDITIYAGWDWTPSATGTNAPKEKVALSNACQVIYYFELASGKTWADYKGVTAEYMLETAEEFDVENSGRTIRLYGPYPLDFFKFNTTTAGNKYAYASLDGTANNNEYIFDQPGGGWKPLSEALIEILGSRPAPRSWFTIEYKIDGSRANVQPFKHMPDNTETGPFVFGLGLAGQADKNTVFIKDVKLIGISASDTVIGQPLYISKQVDTIDFSPYEYPAFSAYGTKDGNGVDNIKRTALDLTAKKVIDAVDPDPITITFDLNTSTGSPAFIAAEGLTISGTTATKTTTKYDPIKFPGATRNDNYIVDGWAKTSTVSAETEYVKESDLYSTDTTLYAIWKLLPNATEDKVIQPKVSSYGGLGALNEDAGYGPFDYDSSASYPNAIWFGLTEAVNTALYAKVQIDFTVTEAPTISPSTPAKLKFHTGAANSWGDVDSDYKDFTSTGAQTEIYTLTTDAMQKGIIIQQNNGVKFTLTITKITLIAPTP